MHLSCVEKKKQKRNEKKRKYWRKWCTSMLFLYKLDETVTEKMIEELYEKDSLGSRTSCEWFAYLRKKKLNLTQIIWNWWLATSFGWWYYSELTDKIGTTQSVNARTDRKNWYYSVGQCLNWPKNLVLLSQSMSEMTKTFGSTQSLNVLTDRKNWYYSISHCLNWAKELVLFRQSAPELTENFRALLNKCFSVAEWYSASGQMTVSV